MPVEITIVTYIVHHYTPTAKEMSKILDEYEDGILIHAKIA
ncbi:hypothetical protein ALNOE001_03580 [Candidatus Methanobinarius endosymbioticus]|uniref:Uncharacterized protein n=1 Tax=Candidatus Methanobinarius endosymbioticus TaxID=2006182 RepID=A0A366MDB6_9EURY|nr:hypothetical protein ALNOE001_03580 [Candidatus Methanobinarius endosymbioticus]